MSYSAAKNFTVVDTFEQADIVLRGNQRAGEVKTTCPQCSADRKKKNDPCLSVNLSKGCWWCGHCNWAGRLKDEADRIADEARANRAPRTYVLPPLVNHSPYSERLLDWFAARGISQATLEHFQVREGVEWMPQEYSRQLNAGAHLDGQEAEEWKQQAKRLAKMNTVQFPYLRDGIVTNIKYRSGRKDFKLFKDAELIFFNLDAVSSPRVKECIIVEGEIDAMSWYEAGFPHVVSVPNGALLSKQEREEYERTGRFNEANAVPLEYLDNCWDRLAHIERFYIAGDLDAPGMKLRQELIRRLGAEKCRTISYGDYKDANELVVKTGDRFALVDCYKSASVVPVPGLFTVQAEMQRLLDLYDYGLPQGLPLGIREFNGHFSLKVGELTAVTGVPSDGKTTFMLFLAVLCSIRFGWKWLIHSPENYPAATLYAYLAQVVLGLEMDLGRPGRMSREQYQAVLQDHVATHFYIVDSNAINTHGGLRKLAETAVKRFGVKGMLLDPWNDVSEEDRKGRDLSDYITWQLSEYRALLRRTGLTLFINAHPSKRPARELNGETNAYPITPPDGIYGGPPWWNRADNILCVRRRREIRGAGDEDFVTEIHVHKVKFHKQVGRPTTPDNPVLLEFEPTTGRFHGHPSLTTITEFAETATGGAPPTLEQQREARFGPLPASDFDGPPLVVTEQGNLFGPEYDHLAVPLPMAHVNDDEEPPF